MGVLDKAYRCFDEVKERAVGVIRQKFGVSPTASSSATSGSGHGGKSSVKARLRWQQCSFSVNLTHDHALTERKSLDEAIQEAMDGRAEVQRVEEGIKEAEIHSKKVEWVEALEKIDGALRYAHRAKTAMRMKVSKCSSADCHRATSFLTRTRSGLCCMHPHPPFSPFFCDSW